MSDIKLLLFPLLVLSQFSFAQTNTPFVKTNGVQFTINNKPYYYTGANYWYGGLLALEQDPKRGKQRLIKELDFLQAQGITNLRVLTAAEGEGMINGKRRVSPALQPREGEFNDSILRGLDFLLVEMAKRNMKAVLYLSNNWEWSGGFLQYLNWAGQITDSTLQHPLSWDDMQDLDSKFYRCNPCIAAYETQVKHILSHVNSYSGIRYSDDPAIMSWELANEPRPMRPAAISAYQSWLLKEAALVKSLDSHHLVTLGTEGIVGTDSSANLYVALHAAAAVDYLTIHIWPKNWEWFADTSISKALPFIFQKTGEYIDAHVLLAQRLNKPLVIEEFGLPRDQQSYQPGSTTHARDAYYRFVLAKQAADRQQHGPIAGINFWAVGGTARPIAGQLFWKDGDDDMGDPPQEEQGLNAVFDTDLSTWAVISAFSKKL